MVYTNDFFFIRQVMYETFILFPQFTDRNYLWMRLTDPYDFNILKVVIV